jgi:hypothetical protein
MQGPLPEFVQIDEMLIANLHAYMEISTVDRNIYKCSGHIPLGMLEKASTAEAELFAVSSTTKGTYWWQRLFREIPEIDLALDRDVME